MEFRILGPLEVCAEGGRTLDLAGKQRALLAVLLLHANEAVSTDRLTDALWGEEPPETAGKALQVYVSRMRKLLGPEGDRLLVTRSPGYALDLDGHELDLHLFERLRDDAGRAMAAGDPGSAAAKLRDALSLWRGPPLADFAFEPFAQGEIARLEELRLTALGERIDADLALGRHADLVGELEALVAENPLRERVRAQLMLALYRARRQAEALDAYQAARRALVDELGIEPSPELQELERRILRQDPSLDIEAAAQPPEAPSGQPPAPRRRAAGTFVAREWELATLGAGLEDALAGRGRLFLLVGEAGIGKSRLADEFAARAKERGALVLWGRCWEAGGAPAYWPWVQSLRTYLRARDADALRAELSGRGPDLAQLLPELADLYPELPPPPTLDPDSARFRLFDSVAAFVRNAAREQTIVLVLDDLHAADEPSLLLLRFLAGELAEMPIVVVGTYREEEATEDEPVSASLSELRRLPSRHLRLGGLAAEHVAAYIELATGVTPPQSLVEAIHTETEGNPLFVGEVVRLLAAEGRLSETPEPGWRLQIPPGLHEVIARRLRSLSKECRRLLTLASALGREFSLEALEQVSDSTEEELLEVLDEAFAARVLADVPGAVGRIRFSHARVRDALYDDMSVARRAQLHRRIGEALEELYRADPEPHLAELAHHFFLAGPGGDVDKTIDYTRRAGDHAVALLAYEEAVRHYDMALRAFERREVKDGREKCELYLALGDALAKAGSMPEAKEAFVAAADLARAAELPEQLARAALGYGGRFVWARAGTDEHLVPFLESALTALGEDESPLRVRLLARLAGALRDQHDREPRAALSQQALDVARRIGDPATLAYALDGRCMAIFWPENPEERIAIASELIQLADEVGDRERAAAARYYRMMFLLELGDMPAVRAGVDAYSRLAEELRQPAQLWLLVATRATLALFEGRFDEADALIDRALALGEQAQGADAVLSHRIHAFTLRWQRGDLDGLEEILTRSAAEYPARPMFRCMLARLYTDLDREADARLVFDDLASDDFSTLPRTNEWLFSLGFLADVAEYLADAPRARMLYEVLSPYAARNACTADYISTGAVSRSLGILASTLSHWQDARRHFEDAFEMNTRMGARPWVAHTQYDYARMLLARGASADRTRAQALLSATQATCRELGMPTLESRITALLEDWATSPS
jgi:DNA-binding SARP family transcriptional activator